MKNFNKLNFETRFKELETKKFYRVTSIDFDEKVVTGIALGGKEEKLFPWFLTKEKQLKKRNSYGKRSIWF